MQRVFTTIRDYWGCISGAGDGLFLLVQKSGFGGELSAKRTDRGTINFHFVKENNITKYIEDVNPGGIDEFYGIRIGKAQNHIHSLHLSTEQRFSSSSYKDTSSKTSRQREIHLDPLFRVIKY